MDDKLSIIKKTASEYRDKFEDTGDHEYLYKYRAYLEVIKILEDK